MPHSAHSWKTRIHHQKPQLLSHLIRSMKELSSPPHRLAVTEARAYLVSHRTSLRGQAGLQDQAQAHVKGADTKRTDTQPGQVRPQNREPVHEESRHDGCKRHGGGAEQVGSPQPPGLGIPHPAPCKAASAQGSVAAMSRHRPPRTRHPAPGAASPAALSRSPSSRRVPAPSLSLSLTPSLSPSVAYRGRPATGSGGESSSSAPGRARKAAGVVRGSHGVREV